MPTPKALHSKSTPKWGSTLWVIEAARRLLGYIHLDPASSEEFNCFVKALMIYTERDDGLAPECEWHGNVFLNPPGGLVTEFWNKLCKAIIKDKTVEKAFWVGFSVEQLCTLASEEFHPMDFSTCILRKRLAFQKEYSEPIYQEITVMGETEQVVVGHKPPVIIPGENPSHGNYVTALGCDPVEFERIFGPHGKIYHGKLSNLSLDLAPLTVLK